MEGRSKGEKRVGIIPGINAVMINFRENSKSDTDKKKTMFVGCFLNTGIDKYEKMTNMAPQKDMAARDPDTR
jgi:hypothetical protein